MQQANFLYNYLPGKTTTEIQSFQYQVNISSKIDNTLLSENNWAFIDAQNLYKGTLEKGWKIDWLRFRQYLKDAHSVTNAFLFFGYIKEYCSLYSHLKRAGFALNFRLTRRLENGKIDGGNVDVDLASFVMDFKYEYHKAIIIADDGDYYKMVDSLNRQNKLKLIISSHPLKKTSELIKRVVGREQIISIHSLRNFIG